jgi:hypothetical protein
MKYLRDITMLLFFTVLFLCCAQDPETKEQSFFPDTDLISVTSPAAGTSFTPASVISFSPANYSYYEIGVFRKQPALSSNNMIANPSDLIYGIIGSGTLSGITADKLKAYDQASGAFGGAAFSGLTAAQSPAYILVWGFDSEMNIKVSSSGSLQVIQ